MRYLSVCSGIEAATVAWERLGWEAVAFSEIDKFPCKLLSHWYPNVPNLGDMTKINWKEWTEKVDVFVGGTPCQSFSVAGLRHSLSDDRGNLTLEFINAANIVQPKFILWENVPGVLNTKDNAFGCFLAGLVGGKSPLLPTTKRRRWPSSGVVFGPERSAAWRVLDAQYFGVPQRRKRVFVVASSGDWTIPFKVLFEPEGVQRNLEEIKKKRKEVVGTLTRRTPGGKSGPAGGTDEACSGYLRPEGLGKVRMLTPIECERLQGFPDGYTNIPGSTEKQRYEALGNSMAVPIMEWIGERIQNYARI